jgi:hypothetical protein
MKTLFKTTIIALFLVIGLSTQLHAQDKYDYAQVIMTTDWISRSIFVMTKEASVESKIDKGVEKNVGFLQKIAELTDQGWEVYSSQEISAYYSGNTTSPGKMVYFLRKKR